LVSRDLIVEHPLRKQERSFSSSHLTASIGYERLFLALIARSAYVEKSSRSLLKDLATDRDPNRGNFTLAEN
jgi:hypothetical protein